MCVPEEVLSIALVQGYESMTLMYKFSLQRLLPTLFSQKHMKFRTHSCVIALAMAILTVGSAQYFAYAQDKPALKSITKTTTTKTTAKTATTKTTAKNAQTTTTTSKTTTTGGTTTGSTTKSDTTKTTSLSTTKVDSTKTTTGGNSTTNTSTNTSTSNSNTSSNALKEWTQGTAGDAIRDALSKGIGNAVKAVAQENGYLGNDLIKIPFPSEFRNVESRLRSLGLNRQVDDAITSMNRAAENAATEAAPIFLGALRKMSIQDAISLVRGDSSAATKFLERTTRTELVEKFKPVISQALDKTEATRHWGDVVGLYNKIPFVSKINSDLPQYVTDKALDGLFVMIAKEESQIRVNPIARTTDVLKQVFGGIFK